MRYHTYGSYMKEKYGQKVYKIPINILVSCPNRDGCVDVSGCIFCGEKGTGFENLPHTFSVKEQLEKNIEYIKKKYKADKYVVYFQNFTNTYLPITELKKYAEEACIKDVVELSFATRPDCISDEYMTALSEISLKYSVKINIEIGLQTVNYRTLDKINRGHSLAEFIDAVLRIKKYKFEVCVHVILSLPWDDEKDVIETAKILSALDIQHVKIHALYVERNTELCRMYEKGEIEMISLDDYVNRVVLFLEYLSPEIVIQRIAGRAPEEDTVFCNWNTSWWKIKDMIEAKLESLNTFQGARCDYLNGKALRKFQLKG